MKSQNKESGSVVHIVVIIILVVALLGVLGFVFWQNFVNKPVTKTADTSQTTSTTKSQSDKTLVISGWAVEGNYTDTSVDFVATPGTSFGTDVVNLTDSKLASVAGCEKNNATGYISRLTGDAQINSDGLTASERYDDFVKTGSDNNGYFAISHVGNYYYMYTSPQAGCSTDGSASDIETAASLSAAKVVKSLRTTAN